MASAAEQMAANLSWGTLGKATDLRQRIFFTIGLLMVYRLGTYVPVPGIDGTALRNFMDDAGQGIGGMLSMFTLDGRMRFQLALKAQDEERFHSQKLREIVLSRRSGGAYELAFTLVYEADGRNAAASAGADATDAAQGALGEIPEYIVVEEVQ